MVLMYLRIIVWRPNHLESNCFSTNLRNQGGHREIKENQQYLSMYRRFMGLHEHKTTV